MPRADSDNAGSKSLTVELRPLSRQLRIGRKLLISAAISVAIAFAQKPVIYPGGVVNAASYVSGLTPGGIATLFGQDLTTVNGVAAADRLPLPVEIGGTSVTVNGTLAPLLAVARAYGREQINFVTPYEVAGSSTATVVVSSNGIPSLPMQVALFTAHPGVFTSDGVHAIMQRADSRQLISTSNPTSPGEVLVLYGTGLGPVRPAVSTGQPAPTDPPAATALVPAVQVGADAAEVLFSGLVPGYAGLYQFNIRIPQGTQSGELDLRVRVGDQSAKLAKMYVTQRGIFRGSTVDKTNGAPIAGAGVIYSRVPVYLPSTDPLHPSRQPLAPGETFVQGSVVTNANGLYQVENVPVGRYLVCAFEQNTPYLDPCKWSGGSGTTVTAGAVSSLEIQMERGVYMKVRIDDPLQLLPPFAPSQLISPPLHVGVVFGTGAYLGTGEAGIDPTGRDFRMAVPVDRPLKLSLSSPNVTFRDENGATLGQSALIPFQPVPYQDVHFRFVVSGPAPGAP